MSAARVLVTGAGGFIGRWSVRSLLLMGFEVHALRAPHPASAPIAELEGACRHAGDLFDTVAMGRLMQEVKPSHLLHLAWVATPGEYARSPDNTRWLTASCALLQAFQAAGGRRVVAAGTCAEYDWSQASVCDEFSTPLIDPQASTVTPYAAAKFRFHHALREFADREGLSYAWARVFFQYGPHEHPDRLVASVIVSLLKGREALCTAGRQIRGFLHVADVGAAFARLLASPVEGPVNVGAEAGLAVRDLISLLGTKIGRSELIRLGARTGGDEPAVLLPNTERLRKLVGWQPQYSLDTGLDDSIAWWRRRLS